MRPTAPKNFDDDPATDRLDPTWKAQVDLRRKRRIHAQTIVHSNCGKKFRLMALRTSELSPNKLLLAYTDVIVTMTSRHCTHTQTDRKSDMPGRVFLP